MDRQGDILNQFVTFTKVFDRQRKLYPDNLRLAVQESIRICREQNVLKDYLEGEGAAAVMYTFADQEKEFNRALRKERDQGVRQQLERDAKGMYEEGLAPETIARIQEVPVETIGEILGLVMA